MPGKFNTPQLHIDCSETKNEIFICELRANLNFMDWLGASQQHPKSSLRNYMEVLCMQDDGKLAWDKIQQQELDAEREGTAGFPQHKRLLTCFVNHFMPSCLYSFEGIPLVRSVYVSFVGTQLHALGHSCDCSVHSWLQVPDLSSTAWLTHTERLAILRRISRSCGPRTPPGRPGSEGAPCAPPIRSSSIS